MEVDRAISGLDELERHLDELVGGGESELNAKLFDDVELQLTGWSFNSLLDTTLTSCLEYNMQPLIPRLLPKLVEILSTYQSDPAVIVSLAIKLLKPVTFTQALSLASSESLVRALQSPASSATILAMTALEKAAKTPSDTAILSNMQDVVAAFITAWLTSPSVEVGEKATKVLGDLLDIDCDQLSAATLSATLNDRSAPVSRQHSGQGLLWRRIFHDSKIYLSFFQLSSLTMMDNAATRRQKTLAQGRILRILPRLALLDFSTLTTSPCPDAERLYTPVNFSTQPNRQQGLLHYAAIWMIDRDDLLMHVTLLDFFRELLDLWSLTEPSNATLLVLCQLVAKGVEMDEVYEQEGALYEALKALRESPGTPHEMTELIGKVLP